jgi:predicted cobalt transporter CbtA
MTIYGIFVFIVLIVLSVLYGNAQPDEPETPVTTATEQDLAEDSDAAARRAEHCTPWDC